MKSVGHSDRAVEIHGVAETAKLTVYADARMFKNLLDSIYSEKEKTVVRELMANAFDAHAAAGCPEREIEVHLPTIMDPTLIVRDYGTGMDHEFMMNLYSALGFSSKTEDNTQTGAFGVGSKSPLSITDSFSVKAFDGDRVRTYIITIPSDEHPQISYAFTTVRPEDYPLESDTPFTEGEITLGAPLPGTKDRVNFERGIEVTVPLDLKRRAAVLDGLASQHFCWFDKPVKFLGALEEIKHKFYTSIAKLGEGLYLATPSSHRDDENYGSDKWNVFVRQGAAVYPLNESQIRSRLQIASKEVILQLCGSGRHVLIDLPLGTANVTLAREAIQYDTASTANIADVVEGCFKGFGALLEGTVGDAKDFYLAQKRIAEKFYPPDQRETFMAQRMAGTLLSLCEKKVLSNYQKWHDTLPAVEEYEERPMHDGKGVERIATGNMIRPPNKPPRRVTEMYLRDFPEGKVLLHKGNLIANYSTPAASIGGAEQHISFRAPSVIFVLPSHLKEWKERITDYCKNEFDAEHLPQSGQGIPIQVIRCAKRNVDDVKASLLKHGILTKSIVMEELPNVAPADVRKRNFSKTSVYPWKTSTWEDTKIEPDYTKAAYYLARVGIAHDVHLAHPTILPKPGGPQRQARTTNHNVQHLIADGVKLGVVDATMPVYRVTENQATRIAETCPHWIHLGSMLADAVEAKLNTNMKVAVGKSRLGAISGFITDMLPSVKNAAEYPADNRYGMFLEYFMDLTADPLFELVAAVKVAVVDSPAAFKEDTTFDRLYRALFTYGSQVDRDKINKYDSLYSAMDARYTYLARFVDDRHSERWIPHARLYLDAVSKVWHKEPASVNLDDYGELKPFVQDMRARLTAIAAKRSQIAASVQAIASVVEIEPEEEEEPYVAAPRTRANLR